MSGSKQFTSVLARRKLSAAATAACLAAGFVGSAHAAPYASNVVITGTTVNFTLNENADSVSYSINGGPAQALGTTKGALSFNLGSPTDTFAITASKNDALGYTIPTGGTVNAVISGLSQPSNESGFNPISDDNLLLTRFNSPRGVAVSQDPNATNFGTAYISNSAAGTTGGRTLVGEGLYALRADQSDAFGNGDTGANPTNPLTAGPLFSTGSASSPFRVSVGPGGDVYVADFSDVNANIFRVTPNLSSGHQMFGGLSAPTEPFTPTGANPLPTGQNHGSTTAVYVEGSVAGGDLKLYTLDEDLNTAHLTGSGTNNDRNSLWRYDINGSPTPYNTNPTKINQSNVLLPTAVSDLTRGADGKFYLAQNRANGAEAGIFVLDENGATVFNSLTATRTLLGDPVAVDIFRNIQGMDVSADQKWMAVMINNSDVAVIPLVNGIPDIANRYVINTGTDINSGRDIAFDAAGNIHYVSSGQGRYRVLSPGGLTTSVLSFDGTDFDFSMLAPALTLYWDIDGATPGSGGAAPAGNWDGVAANFTADAAGSSASTSAATTANDDVVFSAGTDSTGSYTVSVTGTQSAKSVTVARGSVTLAGGTIATPKVSVAAGATATVTGTLSTTALTKEGDGTYVAASTTALGTGTLAVSAGTVQVQAGLPTAVSLDAVTTAGTGKLDLTNNDLVVKNSTVAAVQALLLSGFNGGTWDGPGIQSSAAATDPNGFTALGYLSNADLGATEFSGVPVDADDILVKYTYYGDADLSGNVTLDDYSQFLFGFQNPVPASWSVGDFDYSGTVTLDDFSVFLLVFQNQGGPLGGLAEAITADTGLSEGSRAAMLGAIAAVPEPASLGVLALAGAGMGLMGRRRRN